MTILFVILAAVCKAFADAQAHHGYMVRGGFWGVGTGKRIRFTNYPFDSWHVANSLMITSFIVFGLTYESIIVGRVDTLIMRVATFTVNLLLCGVVFTIIFNINYNRIFK